MNRKLIGLITLALLCVCHAQASLLDTTFNPGTGANGLIEQAITLPSGKILICGNFTVFNGVTNSYIARLNDDGSVDTTFNSQVSYWVRTMAVQPDGKIVIGGFFTSVAGVNTGLISRLNADGSLDTTFTPGTGASGELGEAVDGDADPFIFATALQSDGKILITGNFTNYNGTVIQGIARLQTNGLLDTTFNVGPGINFDSWGRSFLIQSNGQIMLTGWFDNYDNQNYDRMVRINPDGSPDTNFNPQFGISSAVYGAVQLPNQQYIVVGDSQATNGYYTRDMARLNSDGSFDTNFQAVSTDKTECVRLLPNGQLLIGGYFSYVDGQPITSIARLNANGSLDTNFNVAVDNFIWSIDVQPTGRYLVVGGFNHIDGVTRNSIARLLPSTNTVVVSSTNGPAIKILQPVAAVSRVYANTAVLRGTAHGTNGVASLTISPGTASGTTNWSGTANLAPGTNFVTITATDSAGNSSVSFREFIYAASETLTVTNLGAGGVVVPNLNGRSLRAATTYTVTAVAKASYVFNGWTGTVTSSVPTLHFVMQPGEDLQANYIPNPFLPYVGTYQGLAYDSLAPTNANAGFLVLTLGARGAYSAHLTLADAPYAWSGSFSNTLGAAKTITRRGLSPLEITLQFQTNHSLTGSISNGLLTNSLVAYKAFPTTNYAGRYTLLLPSNGYMAINATALGEAQITGMLADGTAFARTVPVGSNGVAPFYFSRGAEAAFGLLTLDSTNAGSVHWEKTSVFGEDGAVTESSYRPPLAWTNGSITLPGAINASFTGEQGNRFIFSATNTDRVALKVNPVNGVLLGSFLDPASGRVTGLHGVVLQQQAMGGGFFVSGGTNGTFTVSAK